MERPGMGPDARRYCHYCNNAKCGVTLICEEKVITWGIRGAHVYL